MAVYTYFWQLCNFVAQMLLLQLLVQLFNPPSAMPGDFFYGVMSSVGQEVIQNFIKIYGGVCGTQTGGFEVSAVLSITEVLRIGGE